MQLRLQILPGRGEVALRAVEWLLEGVGEKDPTQKNHPIE